MDLLLAGVPGIIAHSLGHNASNITRNTVGNTVDKRAKPFANDCKISVTTVTIDTPTLPIVIRASDSSTREQKRWRRRGRQCSSSLGSKQWSNSE